MFYTQFIFRKSYISNIVLKIIKQLSTLFKVQESESILELRISYCFDMQQHMFKYCSVVKNGARSRLSRSNFTFSFFSFFSSHLKLFDLFFELFSKFKCLHKIFSIFKTFSCFLCSSSSIYLKYLIFREGIYLICFGDINLNKFLFCLFEHKLFFSLLPLLIYEYLFLSLPPDTDTLVRRDSHKEITNTRDA